MSVAYLEIWRKKAKIKEGKARSSNYIEILCRYQFSCVFSLLDVTCKAFHVVLCYLHMVFSWSDSVFILAMPFLDSHGVVEFSCFGLARSPDGFEAE